MKEIIVTSMEAGQRMDKLLARYLKEAPKSFLYKMLRKKNITLNGKKADGSEKLRETDVIRLYFSEETLAKFMGETPLLCQTEEEFPCCSLDIVYEDEHVLFLNKPAGMLSQKAAPGDVSLVEYTIGYLLRSGGLTRQDLNHFRPSVCNRLDRNTSGLVAAGKTMAGLQGLSRMFQDRSIHKYYRCLVQGEIRERCHLSGYLRKEEAGNQSYISSGRQPGSRPVETEYEPLLWGKGLTLLEVRLITGRSHQIRAHLASIGHPIIGDAKYGNPGVNRKFRETYGLKHQLLHACRMELPPLSGALENLSEKVVEAELPRDFQKILERELK